MPSDRHVFARPAIAVIILFALAALFSGHASAQCVSLATPGTAYLQNFDTLANTGTSSVLPAGWALRETGTSGNVNSSYTAGTGSSNAGDTYSFGAAGSTDRALGTLLSGTITPTVGACFTNNTGSTIVSLAIAYTGEEWRLGTAARTDQLNFEYSLDATTLGTGTWTGVSALNFVTPDTATIGAKNGNAAADRTAISSTIASLSIPNGATFWIRWTDVDAANADDGLAVDDFSLTPATGVPSATNPTATGAATPGTVQAGSPTLLTVTVTPGANPPSTGLAVTVDLSSIGGSAAQQFFDDGTQGDAVSGNNTFSFQYTVPANAAAGVKTLPASISDAQSRTATASIALTVTSLSTPPSGSASASPGSLQAGAATLFTVNVAGGSNPPSTGLAVSANLSSIGGSAAQQFFDDGSNGDATPGDNIFSFSYTVPSNTTAGAKTLPVSITDAQARSGSTSIALTVQSPPAPSAVKISQVYGGGGNSGATFTNDFVEIFNQSTSPIDITAWSIQNSSATGTTWTVTPLCPTGTCILPSGRYFLVQESAGAGGTTPLPTADAVGTFLMSATAGKVALVNSTTALVGACPPSSNLADLVGYGGANCSEAAAAPALSNTTAAARKSNGCIDTDNNASDFAEVGPIPRNSASPANSCGGNPSLPSGVGTATPTSSEPTATTLLTVTVAPATTPPSTGLTVAADLTAIGGVATQPFFDDGSHGDQTANDNVFTFRATIGAEISTGAKSLPATITDAQSRTATAPITLTVQSPTCGVERWSIKVGTDPGAANVDIGHPVRSTVAALRAIPVSGDPPPARVAPTENTVFVVNGIMTVYKLEDDVDYHIVLQDPAGNTMVTEMPSPGCDGTNSPFAQGIALARGKFDARFTAISSFQTANVPVQMMGVGFFDFIHGQTGVAPNGIELHPLLDIAFTAPSTTVVTPDSNPSVYGQPVTFTATVNIAGPTPTGAVSFFDGASLLGTGTLNGSGHATFTTSALTAGAHSVTASYEGDTAAAQSTSTPLAQNVSQAVPVITWAQPAPITFGGALGSGQLNAAAGGVPGTFAYTPPSGAVLPVGNAQTLSVTFTPSSGNYTSASKSVTIDVLPASGGGSPANLVLTRTLARVGGQVVVTVTLANTGGAAAQNVTLATAKIGTVSGTPLPQSLGAIAAGASVQATVSFPGTVGAPGAPGTLSLSGTYTGATFSNSSRITLP